jgi:hypothetical protein
MAVAEVPDLLIAAQVEVAQEAITLQAERAPKEL